MATAPTSTMMIEITMATIGRAMKNLYMSFGYKRPVFRLIGANTFPKSLIGRHSPIPAW
jgi:hypothetical protein